MKRIIIIILFSFVFQSSLYACSCIGPDKFVQSVQGLILQVEVVNVIQLKMDSNLNNYGYSVTVLKIDRILKGSYAADTVYVLNDRGFECFHSIPVKTKGVKYIITGNIIDQFTSQQRMIPVSFRDKILILDLCLENILFVEEDKVVGNVTKNRAKHGGIIGRTMFLISKKWFSIYTQKHMTAAKRKKKMQTMSMNKFERILHRKKLI